MSTISTIHTLVPSNNIPLGYFDEDNIRFVQNKIKEVLKRQYYQDVLFDRGSIIRLMERAILDRIETVPKMNQRAIMYGTNEYRNHQLDVNKKLNWESHYSLSQRYYDPSVEIIRFDQQKNKPPNRLGYPSVGQTTRFYFT